ncbi:MAG: LysM peptidoglycan-binding domain-containing protein [Aquabacterium sp.]|uniref:LysM peptidoglycan-binding domain-containing protein n=1 Tax=Aquabacterium sp. TaxID=1872578 RepID=UPI0025C5D636|nr:LysM peptidoglycan-binding domain-containing protein [Aquabacterium sp.]MBI5927564.1 LysM peptidoglycan-binding domain-containing protein [Aquabacterium sp.]
MTQRSLFHAARQTRALSVSALTALGVLAGSLTTAHAEGVPNYPITPQQKATAAKVAEAGVPLSELSPNAPDTYTVKRGDTLWDISSLFLKNAWRWPELWGMNMQQIRNPHLIFPGQMLYLDKSNGRARLRVGEPVVGANGTVKLSPRVRAGSLDDAISSVRVHLLEPFFNEAVVFDTSEELLAAPRIVATQEGRVVLSRGETAYVRGDLQGRREFRLFREPRPLRDPSTREVLGFEAQFVGTANVTREGAEGTGADGGPVVIPSTFMLTSLRQEAGVGDRLSPVPPREYTNMVPHAPAQDLAGQIVSIYGEGLAAGQNQIVTINRGARDGVERGHVLALWRAGATVTDKTSDDKATLKLPDERHGLLFVFRVFDRVSYALILNVQEPVKAGDRFTQP